jgi:hypothetical protein
MVQRSFSITFHQRKQRIAMNKIGPAGLVVALVLPAYCQGHAAYERERFFQPRSIVLRASDLRSAYLVRAGKAKYDSGDLSSTGIQGQLRRHFDTVLALLIAGTPESIATALDRLEAASGQHWSAATRRQYSALLIKSRLAQIARLAAYRNRGLFPVNEGANSSTTPIFVDDRDTACAVGHLMRLDGWLRDVEKIQQEDNLVYVTDIVAGPVARWVLTSGITIEEAALIQPAYSWFPRDPAPIPDDAIDPIQTDWAGTFDDLRFSNFKIISNTGNSLQPPANIDVQHSFCELMWCTLLPVSQPIPFVPIVDEETDAILDTVTLWPEYLPPFDEMTRVVVQFDVETTSPWQRIGRKPSGYDLKSWPGEPIFYGRNSLSLFVSGDRDQVFLHHDDNVTHPQPGEPILEIRDGILLEWPPDNFEPVNKMTIVTDFWLTNEQSHQAQMLYFDVITIPEPVSGVIAVVGLLFCVRLRRR